MPEANRQQNPPAYLRYGCALVLTALATLVRLLMLGGMGERLTYTPFIIAVILAVWYGGLGPALLTMALGLLVGLHYATNIIAGRPGGYLAVSIIIALA